MTNGVLYDLDVLLTATYAAAPEAMIAAVGQLLSMVDQRELRKDEAADILVRALGRELERLVADRNQEYLRRLIDALYAVDAVAAMPILDAVAHAHGDDSVRSAAGAIVKHFDGSLARFWKETPTDQVSDDESRAQRLEAHCTQNHDEDGRIQIVFNQLKGLPLSKEDARWVPLERVLDEDVSARVRYATAFGICVNARYDSVNACLSKALQILSEDP